MSDEALANARVNEITGMRRSELGDGGTWTIPGARTKNHRPPAVLRIEGDLIFSTTGTSPVSGWSK